MFPAEIKELFYHKEGKFTCVGVDQTSRRSLRGAMPPLIFSVRPSLTTKISTRRIRGLLRMTVPLAVLLFRNCCKRNCISKDNGQFQKAKLRRARRYTVLHSRNYYDPRVLRMTGSHDVSVFADLQSSYAQGCRSPFPPQNNRKKPPVPPFFFLTNRLVCSIL